MNLQSFVQYIVVPSGFVSFGIIGSLGAFVYFKNRSSPLNRFFAIFALSIACWSIGSSLENVIPDETLALWVLRACYLSASLFTNLFPWFRFRADEAKSDSKAIFTCRISHFSSFCVTHAYSSVHSKAASHRTVRFSHFRSRTRLWSVLFIFLCVS